MTIVRSESTRRTNLKCYPIRLFVTAIPHTSAAFLDPAESVVLKVRATPVLFAEELLYAFAPAN